MFDFSPFDMLTQLRSAQNKLEVEQKRCSQASSGKASGGGASASSNVAQQDRDALSAQRQLVREALEVSCTAICVGGEEFVRAVDVQAMLQVLSRIIASCDDAQTATLVLAFRTLALVADTVPHANEVMAVASRGNRVVPLLVHYVDKPYLLLSCDDLAEEVLRCLSFIALVSSGAQALYEYNTVSHLLSLECLFTDVAFLGQLCLETVHRILTLIHPQSADDIEPALLQLVHSMEDTISVAFCVPSPSTTASGQGAPLPPGGRTTTTATDSSNVEDDLVMPATTVTSLASDKMMRLKTFCLCLASAFERLAPVSPSRHQHLLLRACQVCTRLACFACRLQGEQRQSLLMLALSPVANLYVAQPVDMVPFLIECRLLERLAQVVLEVLASPMRGNPLALSAATTSTTAVARAGEAPTNLTRQQQSTPRRSPRPTPTAPQPLTVATPRPQPQWSPRPSADTTVMNSSAHSLLHSQLALSSSHRGHHRLSSTATAAAAAATADDDEAIALLGGSTVLSPSTPPRDRTDEGLVARRHTSDLGVPTRNAGSPLNASLETPAVEGNSGPTDANASAAAAPTGAQTFASLLLGSDTTQLPFIAEETCVLPVLELLLVLLPHTRRCTESHFDHLNVAQPYFSWQWEDDFHNRNDCAEGLGQRLEREYQKRRNKGLKTGAPVVITHTSPRLLSVDYFRLSFTGTHGHSTRRLFRQSAISGFAHTLVTGLQAGCQCGVCTAASPPPLHSKNAKGKGSRGRHRGRSDGGVVSASSANPFAAASSSGYPGGRAVPPQSPTGASFLGASTSHAPLRRVGSSRRAEAAPVTDEAPSMVDESRTTLEQSTLTQLLFEDSSAPLDGNGLRSGTTPSPRRRPSSDSHQSQGVPVTGASPRTALAAEETALGAAAASIPHRRVEARVVRVQGELDGTAPPPPQPTDALPSFRRSTHVAALSVDRLRADSVPSSLTSLTPSSTPSPSRASASMSANSSHNNRGGNTGSAALGERTVRQLRFTGGSVDGRVAVPQGSQSHTVASGLSTATSVPLGGLTSREVSTITSQAAPTAQRRRRRGGWSCCQVLDVAPNPEDEESFSEYASARAVSISSGRRTSRGVANNTGSRQSRHRSLYASVLPASSEKDDRSLLQDFTEELLSSDTLRRRFLQDDVIRSLLTQFLPRVLAIIRNSVNAVVVRHASVLLLRCVSLACEWAEGDDEAACTVAKAKAGASLSSLQAQPPNTAADRDAAAATTHTSARKTSFWSFSGRASLDRGSSRSRTGHPPAPSPSIANPLLGDSLAHATPTASGATVATVNVRGPNTRRVQDALTPCRGALAEALVYLLSTNEKDPQPILAPFFPFRPCSEDPRMLYAVLQMGLSVEFCTYVPTIRGEMRLAAADAVLHLMKLESRGTSCVDVGERADGALPSPGSCVFADRGSRAQLPPLGPGPAKTDAPRVDAHTVPGWHAFTIAEARSVQQLAERISKAVHTDIGVNNLVVGYGAPLRLVGATAVMEAAAMAKRDSNPSAVIEAATNTPNAACTYHQDLTSARQGFIQVFRRLSELIEARNRPGRLTHGDVLFALDGPSCGLVADQHKPVWEENGMESGGQCVPHSTPPSPAVSLVIMGDTAASPGTGTAGHGGAPRFVDGPTAAVTAAQSDVIRHTNDAAKRENSLADLLATASAAGGASGSVSLVTPAVDLSEPAELRRALEACVLTLDETEPVRAARLAVALYRLLRETDLTMRVLVTKAPQVLDEVAQSLLIWAFPRFRQREVHGATGGSLVGTGGVLDTLNGTDDRAQVTLNLAPTTCQQLSALKQELTFAVGERLGLSAGVTRASSLTSLQPVRFSKREGKGKLSSTVADLTWTPVAIHLERFVNEVNTDARAETSGQLSGDAEVPTTDESHCELHIAGHVLRYVPVELDPRALLIICTSSIGTLQSLIIQHAIEPFQPLTRPPTHSAATVPAPTAPGTADQRVAQPPVASPASEYTDSDDDSADDGPGASPVGTRPHRDQRGATRRGARGAAAADPAVPPTWVDCARRESRGTSTKERTPSLAAPARRTKALLKSTESLDTPLFDDTHGPYDGIRQACAAPLKPTEARTPRQSSRSPIAGQRLSPGRSSPTATASALLNEQKQGAASIPTSGRYLRTTGERLAAITPSRLLLLVDGVPLLCPLTTLIDALCYYAASGESLRDYVDEEAADDDEGSRDPGTSGDAAGDRGDGSHPAPSAAAALDDSTAATALRHLSFWVTIHRVQYVLLEEPLPDTLRATQAKCGCHGGASIYKSAPSFYCSPKHIFSMLHETKSEPADGALRLLHALTLASHECEPLDRLSSSPTFSAALSASPTGTTDPSGCSSQTFGAADTTTSTSGSLSAPNSAVFREHRLRSALVHDLYSQLDTILLPPLMYRALGDCFDSSTVGTHLASYALWNYPLIFPFAMRVALLDLFLGARRTMSPRVIKGTVRFLSSQVSSRFLGFQWMSRSQNAVTSNTTRVPVKVRRERLLTDGARLLRRYAFCPFQLDVHFHGEPGIGIGPALELFELMAKALATPETGMWRTEVDTSGRRTASPLLYPTAYPTHRSLMHFETLGLLMGRLLQLRRPSCVRFHPLFLRRLLFRSTMPSVQEASNSMALLDPDLEKMLVSLTTMSADELAACELMFVLPASEPNKPEIPLCPQGATVAVTNANVASFVRAVRHYHLEYCVDVALQAFRVGLQNTLNPVYLSMFTVDEIANLFSGPTGKIWSSREAFRRDVVPLHGYTRTSPMIQYLVEIVPAWGEARQRAFLRFVTGSGTLPAGGLAEPIKVVRRDAGAVDDDAEETAIPVTESRGASVADTGSLPTTSTCFNYLKLPQYPSKSILEARLLRAIDEGQSGFMLT